MLIFFLFDHNYDIYIITSPEISDYYSILQIKTYLRQTALQKN